MTHHSHNHWRKKLTICTSFIFIHRICLAHWCSMFIKTINFAYFLFNFNLTYFLSILSSRVTWFSEIIPQTLLSNFNWMSNDLCCSVTIHLDFLIQMIFLRKWKSRKERKEIHPNTSWFSVLLFKFKDDMTAVISMMLI